MTEHTAMRILDANLNRACEGLRTIEDVIRFQPDPLLSTREIRELRHRIRTCFAGMESSLLRCRESSNDPGHVVSLNSSLDLELTQRDIFAANFRRIQEALRSIEEAAKGIGSPNQVLTIEKCRFEAYRLHKQIAELSTAANNRKTLPAGLYGITDRVSSLGRGNVETVRLMLQAGVRIIQYREKELSRKEMVREVREIRKLTEENRAVFIINDYVDLALLSGADGVHLGQDDMSIQDARGLLGMEKVIGVSTHTPEQLAAAEDSGADYIGVGPLFQTFTKKDVCEPVGLEYLEYAVKHSRLPFIAIGGIKQHNIEDVLRRGAKRICLVTEITGAEDIGKTIGTLQNKINNYRRIENDHNHTDGCSAKRASYPTDAGCAGR